MPSNPTSEPEPSDAQSNGTQPKIPRNDGAIDISIVVPIFNEEESLPVLYEEIVAALDGGDWSFEIVLIDDCSTDRSFKVMHGLHQRDGRVKIVKFRSNCGQTAAMAAGFDEARGDLVATLDGDLQNDPADIPRMVNLLVEGDYDIVAGWRRRREDGWLLRRLPSIVANRLIAIFTGVKIHDTGCTLKIFKGDLVRSMSIYADQHRFLPVMSAGSGARVTETVVNHRPRRFGESKYGLSRATRVLLDLLSIKMIAQFSQRPLHYFGIVSLTSLVAAMFFLLVGFVSSDSKASRAAAAIPDAASGAYEMNNWEFAVVSVVITVLMMVVFFAMLGLLGELAVKASGMHRRGILDRILNELH